MRYFELTEDAVTLLTGAVYARIHWLQEQRTAIRELNNGLFSDEQISLYNQWVDEELKLQTLVNYLNA